MLAIDGCSGWISVQGKHVSLCYKTVLMTTEDVEQSIHTVLWCKLTHWAVWILINYDNLLITTISIIIRDY